MSKYQESCRKAYRKLGCSKAATIERQCYEHGKKFGEIINQLYHLLGTSVHGWVEFYRGYDNEVKLKKK